MTVIFFRRCKSPFSRPLLIFFFGFLFGFFTLNSLNSSTISWLDWSTRCSKQQLIDSSVGARYQRAFNVQRIALGKNNAYAADSFKGLNGGSGAGDHLLMLGVMTAAKYVDSRAYNVWQTWAHQIPGKTFFFVAENTTSQYADSMPIINLKGVDDVYPPQKKSFAMMRWMYDNFLEDFQWFMRADDDLYVRNEKLSAFLRSLDANKAHMIGQAGLGKGGEYGQLALGAKDNYCMGGPGIILSREALRQVGPHLEACLLELATGHEDVELGRCVRRYVGITCTWNYEMQTFFHNNQTSGWSSDAAITDDFRKVITLHPVKNPDLMLKMHVYSLSLRLAALRATKVILARQFRALLPLPAVVEGMEGSIRSAAPPSVLSQQQQFSALSPAQQLRLTRRMINSPIDLAYWNYISMNKLLFCADRVNCPRHTIDGNTRAAIKQIIQQLFDKFNMDARQRSRVLQFQNLQYGYTRVEPRYGVDYVLDIVLWFKKLRPATTFTVRRHTYVQQMFGAVEARTEAEYRATHYVSTSKHNDGQNYGEMNVQSSANMMRMEKKEKASLLAVEQASRMSMVEKAESESNALLYIVMALQGRAATFQRFTHNLRRILPTEERDVKIIIVLYRSPNLTENVVISETVAELSRFLHVRVLNMESSGSILGDGSKSFSSGFSRGQALKIGASLAPDDALLFFTDVDMLFDYATLQRLRLNTISGVQVYFPIIFSEYAQNYWLSTDYNTGAYDGDVVEEMHWKKYASDHGYFRSFGFGILSIYGADFRRVGGFNTTIHGWGMEDVDFFERCIRAKFLRVLRAPDPSLVHVAHTIQCRRDTMPIAQYHMCVGTKAASLASQDFLVQQIQPHF